MTAASTSWFDYAIPELLKARDWARLYEIQRTRPRLVELSPNETPPPRSADQLLLPGILDRYEGKVVLYVRPEPILPDHSRQMLLRLPSPGPQNSMKAVLTTTERHENALVA